MVKAAIRWYVLLRLISRALFKKLVWRSERTDGKDKSQSRVAGPEYTPATMRKRQNVRTWKRQPETQQHEYALKGKMEEHAMQIQHGKENGFGWANY